MNNTDQIRLAFEDAVSVVLQPLLIRFGLTQTRIHEDSADFESPRVSFRLLHSPLSYELDLVIALKDKPSERFALQDVVEAAGCTEPTFFQASTADRLFQCVNSITQLLEKYGDGALVGQTDAFDQMKQVSAERSQKLTDEVISRPIREAAEASWKSKDYGEVKKLYEAVSGELTDSEKRRLQFATEHLGDR